MLKSLARQGQQASLGLETSGTDACASREQVPMVSFWAKGPLVHILAPKTQRDASHEISIFLILTSDLTIDHCSGCGHGASILWSPNCAW